ncbi:MAG: hypothetical protein HY834_08970 [Devosia nanyangense]|uniref:Uncharacterized protein n=1 Tax=Devosia nanyangense TaxID=1228055 RepID=A0A933L0S3_9HYPH|nr:hypothetical protein [Devosia nanyangense]
MIGTVDARLTDQLWVPIAEAARRHNVSRAAMHKRVGKLVELGRLATRPGQRGTVLVNSVALDRAIAQETDPAQQLRNGTSAAPVSPEPEDETDEGPAAPGSPSYLSSRAARETYQAENARLDLELRLDKLADKDRAEQHTIATMRKLRDRLLGLPAMVSDRLASAPDARAIRTILAEELRKALDGLAKQLDGLYDEDDDDGPDDSTDGGEPEAAA